MARNPYWYSIPEWYGIQQHKDGTLLPVGSAYDARNIETGDGNLATAKGFTRWIAPTVAGLPRKLRRLIITNGSDRVYVVREDSVFAWEVGENSWTDLYHLSDDADANRIDYLQTRIGTKDVLLISTGVEPIIVIDTDLGIVVDTFDSGLYSYEGTVSAYDADLRKITLSTSMSAEAQRRCLAYGVNYNGTYADVYQVASATEIILTATLGNAPQAGDSVTIRGGGSNAHVSYLEMYANRLFAAGDPDASCRLYWSAVPGDGRTIADWLSVDGSADASGGYVEVGDSHTDPIIGLTAISNQLIIWKRYSVWRLYGDRPSTFTLERIDRESDLMSNAGVITKYDTPYLLMPNGIHRYDSVSVVPVDNGNQYLRRFFELNPDVSNSKAASCNNRFYMTCKVNPASTFDDTIIVYDVARNSYMIRDGFQIVDLAAVGSHIYVLTGTGDICEFERGDTYNGDPINAYWITQPMDFGAKMNRHQLTAMYAHLKGAAIQVTALGDHLDKNGFVVKMPLRDDYATIRFQTDQSYVVRLKFENVNGSTFCVCGGVNLYVKTETKE